LVLAVSVNTAVGSYGFGDLYSHRISINHNLVTREIRRARCKFGKLVAIVKWDLCVVEIKIPKLSFGGPERSELLDFHQIIEEKLEKLVKWASFLSNIRMNFGPKRKKAQGIFQKSISTFSQTHCSFFLLVVGSLACSTCARNLNWNNSKKLPKMVIQENFSA